MITLRATGILLIAIGVASGCGSSSGGPASAPKASTTTLPSTGTSLPQTTTTPRRDPFDAHPPVDLHWTDSSGYQYEIKAIAPTLATSSVKAPPGQTSVYLVPGTDYIELTNDTPGRNAPPLTVDVTFAVGAPGTSCQNIYNCIVIGSRNYTHWGSDIVGGIGEAGQNGLAPGASVRGGAPSPQQSSTSFSESVSTKPFYWQVEWSTEGQGHPSDQAPPGQESPWYSSDGSAAPRSIQTSTSNDWANN